MPASQLTDVCIHCRKPLFGQDDSPKFKTGKRGPAPSMHKACQDAMHLKQRIIDALLSDGALGENSPIWQRWSDEKKQTLVSDIQRVVNGDLQMNARPRAMTAAMYGLNLEVGHVYRVTNGAGEVRFVKVLDGDCDSMTAIGALSWARSESGRFASIKRATWQRWADSKSVAEIVA